ncbi:MAG: Hsp70 family protein [Gemmataceae bacterium]
MRYLIGIDLGTTNSALAYIDLRPAKGKPGGVIKPFPIPQLVKLGEVGPRELLPSFLYLPGPHDLPPGAAALPWDPARTHIVGEFARNHGAKVPGRLVTSAKSWLCHAGVDRSAPLLPWSAPPDVHRISPVEASTRYLQHMVEGWNNVIAKGDPDAELQKQMVVLTVPASFDDMARTLTVEAARKAGIENLTLLEEPQAAFYCWLATHSAQEAAHLKPGDLCLVVDVGGGTTDFSLIQAIEQEGEIGFVRQAVGDHLLLGGDNMDLALAKFVETKLPQAGRLDAAQYGLLTQACRQAKETLLAPHPPAAYTVTVMGRGRQVIGGSLHTSLTPEEVKKTILDGFLPSVTRNSEPHRGARTGLHEMGLPYVSDPGITRHLAGFLNKHLSEGEPGHAPLSSSDRGRGAGGEGVPTTPRAILFNGGVFQPAILRDRVVDVLTHWWHTPDHPYQPLVLTNPSLDLAVAWGAAHFAWLKHTGGRRIGGGIARSYYIGVQGGDADGKRSVVCVVPQHLEEGQEVTLEKPELELALGQPVQFPLFTSTVRGDDKAGELLSVAPTQLGQLPPLHTILRGGKRAGTRNVPVTLAARCTEIGTLELYCVAREGDNRWRLEFNVRDVVKEPEDEDETPRSGEPSLTDVWPEEQVQAAAALIRASYDSASAPPGADAARLAVPASQLTKAIEAALDAPRDKWPTGLCRRMWDFLSEVAEKRRASPQHLGRWYNLVGFCLRPGFGDSLDRFRIDQLWKIVHAPRVQGGKQVMGPPEGGADFWVMWRRVAGGLTLQYQNAFFNRLRAVLIPAKSKNVAKPHPNELAEMWRAAASFERIDAKSKEALGQPLLKLGRRSPVPPHVFWALTRLGARVLIYGPLNTVIHPEVAQTWLESLLPFDPANDNERLGWAFCLAQLAARAANAPSTSTTAIAAAC